jgi:hypothetical protein
MSTPISSATQAQPVAQTQDASAKAPEHQPAPVPADTIQLSKAAQAILQEATETPAVTAKEAAAGDHQAQRLLAKQAAKMAAEKAELEQKPVHVVA